MTTRNNDSYRFIKTGMFTAAAFTVIDAVVGQMSDGIWENSPAYEKYWRFVDAWRDKNGEVFIKVSAADYEDEEDCYRRSWHRIRNRFAGKTDDEIRSFFAKHIRAVVKDELGCDFKNSMNLDKTSAYLAMVNFREVYAVEEILRSGKCNTESAKTVIGCKRSEEQSRRISELNAERGRAEMEHVVALKEIREHINSEIEKLEEKLKTAEKQLHSRYNAECARIRAELDAIG